MNQRLNNTQGLSLAMAVWLAHDEYDDGAEQFAGRDVISATTLLKPTRQLILGNRVPPEERQVDIADLVPSCFGNAIHGAVEQAWKQGYRQSMKRLGYPQKMIDKVLVNPQDHELKDGAIPVYVEQRRFREIEVEGHKIVISGKYDLIVNGELNDIKTTSVYTYIKRSKEEDYRIQGSLYRWINPETVTSDTMFIQHVFTDWSPAQARASKDYPQSRLVEFRVNLLSLQETENWIRSKIREILANQALPEPEIIRCSDKDLWKSDPQFKYYADPKKAAEGGRSTKNFPNYPAAAAYRNQQGKGVIVTVPGQVKACGYCAAFPICTQKDEYTHDRS